MSQRYFFFPGVGFIMTATTWTIICNAPASYDGKIELDCEARLLRRKRLTFDGGSFMVDLPEVTSFYDGDAFELSDGRHIVVRASAESLIYIRGNLPRLA